MNDVPRDPDDPSGDSFPFGHFLVEKVLGQGTFATVYQAVLVGEFGIHKPVALKVLRRRIAGFEDKGTAGLINEARLGARIRHPNLVEFYECGQVGDRIYISMELIEGPNLAQVRTTAKELPYPVDQSLVVTIALQTARGLGALHAATLDGKRMEAIHQDLKPGNILLTSTGQAKITDFGISRFATDFYMTLGIEGPRGSPLYMSPEQARGEMLTQASDVFSWGTTLLELVVGRPVFAAPSLEEILQKIQRADTGDALDIARKRVPELAKVLERCFDPRVSSRIPDGNALVAELRAVPQPPFGDEAITRIAKDIYAILSDRMGLVASQSVRHLLRPADDEGEGGAINLAAAELGERTPDNMASMDDTGRWTRGDVSGEEAIRFPDEEPSDEGPAQLGPSDTTLHRLTEEDEGESHGFGIWIAAVVMGIVVLGGLVALAVVLPWDRLGSRGGDGIVGDETPTEVVTERSGDATEAPTPAVVEPETPTLAVVEPETPTPAVVEPETPTPAVVEPETPTPAVVEPETPTPDLAPALNLQHTPVSRGILGKDVALALRISPAGSYRAVVHYRALPGGAWQAWTGYGGDDGSLSLTIPAGEWQAQDSTTVEYWIQVTGNDLEGTSGSAGSPHRYALY